VQGQKRIRDYGIIIGDLIPGKRNAITDVAGVRVGHCTLDHGPVKTGVTAVLPHPGNIFEDKVMAAAHVINGFGKSMGIIQIEELGTLETPILLTNTLSVGEAASALISHMVAGNKDIGCKAGTVNPLVCECNDFPLNDIRGLHVTKEHVYAAIREAAEVFREGGVGAGTGMSCYQLKGGIGSASRMIDLDSGKYTVGTLVLTNMGRKQDLMINGDPLGKRRAKGEIATPPDHPDGSIIIIIATDIPLTERQLKRCAKRSAVGLHRTGSHMDTGSGEIAIAFSTVNRIRSGSREALLPIRMINESRINRVFRAVAQATEEAILNSMITADATVGRAGCKRRALRDILKEYGTPPGKEVQ